MDLQAALLIDYVQPLLSQHGFRRRKNLFYASCEGNFLLVEVQRSARSSEGQLLITANFGVISRRVAKVMDPLATLSPRYPTWHWRQRIGFLTPEKRDLWWSVTDESDLVVAGTEFIGTVERFGLPALYVAAPDEALRDMWLRGTARGISELQRLFFLSAMLVTLGPRSELDTVLSDLYDLPPNDPSAPTVRAHLERLASVLRAPEAVMETG